MIPGAILVVEDDAQHALLVRATFTAANLVNSVQVVGDAEKAIAYLGGQGPYADRVRHPLPIAVLLDINLPDRSGLDVLAWMREQPALRSIPVVVLTASEEDADLDRAYAVGADSYLTKPVGFDALLDVVRGLGLRWQLVGSHP